MGAPVPPVTDRLCSSPEAWAVAVLMPPASPACRVVGNVTAPASSAAYPTTVWSRRAVGEKNPPEPLSLTSPV